MAQEVPPYMPPSEPYQPYPPVPPIPPPPTRRRGGCLLLLFLIFAWVAVVGGAYFLHLTVDLPAVDTLMAGGPSRSVTILDDRGRLIAVRGLTKGALVDVTQLPSYVPNAFIAIEDRRFRHHFGIDPVGLTRAAYQNYRRHVVVQGGSTLTQQLAKNLFLEPKRTFERKLQEAMLALYLETHYSKDEILTLYLNRVSFGAGVTGIEAAAQRFFGKHASQLSLVEASMLAGIVKAPSRYNPLADPDACHNRAVLVLQAMARDSYIDDATLQEALSTRTRVVNGSAPPGSDYFADWVMAQLSSHAGEINVPLIVETSFDLDMQTFAERAVNAELARDGAAMNAGQGVLVALSPDGAVRAMVGGRNYDESPFNRATDARRQPGSAFKPFVYLAAFEAGHTPEDVMNDGPVDIHGWKPKNYEGEGYQGDITLTQAFASSSNAVAAQLVAQVGPGTVAHTARRLGITSPLHAFTSIALGTSVVSPLELTSSYAPIANGGLAAPPYAILRIRTADGKLVWQRQTAEARRVVGPENLRQMTTIMTAVVNGGTGRAAQMARPVAGKTGTSQDFRDAWFVGFTADLVCGVWVGNDNNAAMKRASGGTLPARIFHSFMEGAESGMPVRALPGQDAEDLAVAAEVPSAEATPDGATQKTPEQKSAEPKTPVQKDKLQNLFEQLLGH